MVVVVVVVGATFNSKTVYWEWKPAICMLLSQAEHTLGGGGGGGCNG